MFRKDSPDLKGDVDGFLAKHPPARFSATRFWTAT